MSDNSVARSTPFLLGLIVGTLAGAAAALVLAPRPGRETRASLAQELKRMLLNSSVLDLAAWTELKNEEDRRNLVEHIERIRSAGL